jgi:aminoglycoside phosphotransferase
LGRINIMKTYSIPQYGITVTVEDNRAGEITSELKKQLIDHEDDFSTYITKNGISAPQEAVAEAQADALEAFILALACEGYDISEPRFVKALQTSLEAIANNS